jgi:Flp pilus assembly protein TadG
MQTEETEVGERMPSWSSNQALLSLSSDQKAQSLIEFAFMLPAFLLVVTGMFAFGVAFTN